MPCTGLWFNKPPGIRPCPLYTSPVALTDGLLCEFEGLSLAVIRLGVYYHLRKLKRTVWSKGKRSRNKASVGEPADGSLRIHTLFIRKQHIYTIVVCAGYDTHIVRKRIIGSNKPGDMTLQQAKRTLCHWWRDIRSPALHISLTHIICMQVTCDISHTYPYLTQYTHASFTNWIK